MLREVASDLDALNKSLRALNASIGHYIDRLTRNRTPQEVLELFDQWFLSYVILSPSNSVSLSFQLASLYE